MKMVKTVFGSAYLCDGCEDWLSTDIELFNERDGKMLCNDCTVWCEICDMNQTTTVDSKFCDSCRREYKESDER
jgi:hypothetical protein